MKLRIQRHFIRCDRENGVVDLDPKELGLLDEGVHNTQFNVVPLNPAAVELVAISYLADEEDFEARERFDATLASDILDSVEED